jgi:hypothetical protein
MPDHRGRRRALRLLTVCCLAVSAMLSLPTSAGAQDPPSGGFSVPLACWTDRSCIVQFHPDQGPGAVAVDYRCGGATTDGRRGTDFRVRHVTEMRSGVPVLAAAPGKIITTVDHYPDLPLSEGTIAGDPAAADGNSVMMEHGEGWQSRYTHLRRGSLKVEVGEWVDRGAILGRAGRSGRADFPHLHFEIHYRGGIIDPFSGLPPQSGCGKEHRPLWNQEARQALTYRDGGLLDSGFASHRITAPEIWEGPPRLKRATSRTETLVFWASAYLLNQGDREEIKLLGPDGIAIGRAAEVLEQDHNDRVRTLTVERPQDGWRPGMYLGIYRVERGTGDAPQVVVDATKALVVR